MHFMVSFTPYQNISPYLFVLPRSYDTWFRVIMVVSCPLCLWECEQSPQACVSFCLAATFAVDGSWEVPRPERAGNARGPLPPGEATWLFLSPARVQAQLCRWLQYASLDPAAPGSFSAMEADVTIATTVKAGIVSSMALPTPLHHKKIL